MVVLLEAGQEDALPPLRHVVHLDVVEERALDAELAGVRVAVRVIDPHLSFFMLRTPVANHNKRQALYTHLSCSCPNAQIRLGSRSLRRSGRSAGMQER